MRLVDAGVTLELTKQINEEKMRKACTMDMLATDIADYLVRKGVSASSIHTSSSS